MSAAVTRIGRYALFRPIAAGGMATVHLGRLIGPVGFARTVAIKRLHEHYATDPEFVSMFLDEARLAARIHHPNVVATLDVVTLDGELFIVMEYVHGDSLARLIRAAQASGEPVDPKIGASIVGAALHGLHAAHEARNEAGEALGIVHRDVSPQNILVGADGVSRVLDFGVAKAVNRIHSTRGGDLKGKFRYMAPEQIRNERVDRRTDVYAAAIVLFELLTGGRYTDADDPAAIVFETVTRKPVPPSARRADLPAALDAVVLKALSVDPDHRHASAEEFALALEDAVGVASPAKIGRWVTGLARAVLDERAKHVAETESSPDARPTSSLPPPLMGPPRPGPGTLVTGELPSGLSNVSSSLSVAPQDRTRARLTLIGLGGLGALGAAVVLAVLVHVLRRPDAVAGAAQAQSAVAASEPAPTTADSTGAPVEGADASMAASESSGPTASASAGAWAPKGKSGGGRHPGLASGHPAPANEPPDDIFRKRR